MASSGKKGKKTKGKTVPLNDFLQETTGITPTIRKTNLNWADEVEDNYDQYESRPKDVILPTAPKSARGFDEFSERIPQNPPFNAYITNLPYDVLDEEIVEFFGGLKITSMRIPREERTGEPQRLKGYGYVEFADRDSLIGALNITACTLKNRRIRIEVADNSDNDRKRGGRMDNNRDRSDRPETSGDWRSRPRVDPPEMSRNRSSGFSRDRDNGPMDRDKGGSWRDSRDRPNLKEMDRGKDGFGDRGRFNDKDGERRGFGSRRNDDREFSRDSAIDRAEPRTRPKLMLQQRSVPPQAEVEQNGSQETSNTVPTSSNIFGGAKPVDTSIRERQIEELLAKQSERHAGDSRESRRDDRRDWNRREDEGRWGRDKRKDSPIRRTSPDYRNDHSPVRNRNSYNHRGDSPGRKYSPERRRRSPEMKRDSPERRRWSPDRRDSSDRHRRSPDFRRDSPERRRRKSPDYRANSPIHRRNSPDYSRNSLDRQRRSSPDYRKNSPDYRGNSAERSRNSPDLRRDSPTQGGSPKQRGRSPKSNWEQRRLSPEPADRSDSPEQRQPSPERKKKSPDRSKAVRANQRKNDDRDKKGANKNEKSQKNDREKTRKDEKNTSRENHEREMPKMQEPETPNFAVSNKYAFLPEED